MMNDIKKTEPLGADTNILSALLCQHHLLRKILKDARGKIFTNEQDLEGAERDLRFFRETLDEHLRIEEKVFYPRIIKNLETKNIDTKSIQEFIFKMKDIGDRVYRFLDEYPGVAQMGSKKERFQEDFSYTEELLLIRISTEEESVYLYWDLS